MIQRTPQLITTTELRTKLDEALDICQKEPVYIMKHSKIIAVMVAYATWEHIQEDVATIQQETEAAEKRVAELKAEYERASKEPMP